MKQLAIFANHTLDSFATVIFEDTEPVPESELVSIYGTALLNHAKSNRKWKSIYTPIFRFLKLNEKTGYWESYGNWYGISGNKIDFV